jgi:hypothetical protein
MRDLDDAFSGTLRSVSRVANLSASYSINSKHEADAANREQVYRWIDAMIEASYWAGMLRALSNDEAGYLDNLREGIEEQIDYALRGDALDLSVFTEARASLNQAMNHRPYEVRRVQVEQRLVNTTSAENSP